MLSSLFSMQRTYSKHRVSPRCSYARSKPHPYLVVGEVYPANDSSRRLLELGIPPPADREV